MSQSQNTTTDNSNKTARPVQIIKELFNYYQDREGKLIYLLYKKGTTQKEIADTLNVDRSFVAQRFPIGGKK